MQNITIQQRIFGGFLNSVLDISHYIVLYRRNRIIRYFWKTYSFCIYKTLFSNLLFISLIIYNSQYKMNFSRHFIYLQNLTLNHNL